MAPVPMAETVAGLVVRLDEWRHALLLQEDPGTVATVPSVAAEIVRLIELRVSPELAGTGPHPPTQGGV